MQELCACYDEFRSWKEGGVSRAILLGHARRHCLLYRELAKAAQASDPWTLFWKLYPKHHLFLHCADTDVNPRLEWNYRDESEIGDAVDVATACNPAHLHTAVIHKYRVTFDAEPLDGQ